MDKQVLKQATFDYSIIVYQKDILINETYVKNVSYNQVKKALINFDNIYKNDNGIFTICGKDLPILKTYATKEGIIFDLKTNFCKETQETLALLFEDMAFVINNFLLDD